MQETLQHMSTAQPQPVPFLEKTVAKVLQYYAALGQVASVAEFYHLQTPTLRVDGIAPFEVTRTYASVVSSLIKCGLAGMCPSLESVHHSGVFLYFSL